MSHTIRDSARDARSKFKQSNGLHDATLPKILVVGHFGVGKTSLLQRLTYGSFTPDVSITPGIDVVPFEIGERQASFLEWQPSMKEAPDKVDVVATLILTTAVNIKAAARDLANWAKQLDAANVGLSHPRSLVVTGVDRGISEDTLQAFAEQPGIDSVFPTSAMDGTGIEKLREYIRTRVDWPKEEEQDETKVAVITAVRRLSETLCELIANDPTALRHIHWRQLEEIIATALEALGFAVELTPSTKDGGKDVIATCRLSNKVQKFYVEIKHWREGGRPGERHVSDFVEVNLKDQTAGGLFLSSSGYTQSVYGRLAEIAQQRVRLGEQEKIVSLCQYFVRAKETCWVPQAPLPTVLFEKTVGNGPR